MSPLPIIARQRALSQVGEIRCGGEKKANAPGAKLESFRLTSQHREILETAAAKWGGDVTPWQSPAGDAFQLYTTASALPCMVIVGYSLHRVYELWEGATKCVRRCDGVEEQLSEKPCICNATGKDECQTITRLMVMLPETGTSLGWKLRSTGEIAADELDGAMMVAEKLANGRAFVPAIIRLTQRRSVSGGQTKRWVTPVLDFNLGDMVGTIALPAPVEGEIGGYTPLAALPGVTVDEALGVVNGQAPNTRTARSAQPIGDTEDFSDYAAPTPDLPAPPPPEPTPKLLTKAQEKKLGVLVGTLRDKEQRITTEHLWAAVAEMRDFPLNEMVELLHPYGADDDGKLHFGPLLASLTRDEGSQLIDRLEAMETAAVV